MSGLQMTLFISATSLIFALIGGLILALFDLSKFAVLRWFSLALGEIIRNTPILVQLLWEYYVLPTVFSIRVCSLVGSLLVVSLNRAAFISEVSRAGIQAVAKGDREAALVLGLTPA